MKPPTGNSETAMRALPASRTRPDGPLTMAAFEPAPVPAYDVAFTAEPPPEPPKPRRYRGQSPEERRVDRRRRLLTTGLDLFGTVGYQKSSVERLCSTSGVTGRHFYEEFASREALLAAVFDEVMTRCVDAAVAAVDQAGPDCDAVIEAGVSAYVRSMLSDRRAAQIVTIEAMAIGAPADAAWRHQCLRFADYMLSVGNQLIEQGAPIDGHDITPIALVGAIHELIRSWLLADPADALPADAIVGEATRIVRSVARTSAH